MIDFLSQPWHWSVGGLMIAFVMFLLIFSGKRFGVSGSFDDLCSASGLGKYISKFNYNWKDQLWLLLFLGGTIIGGFIASNFLLQEVPIQVNESTLQALSDLGIGSPKQAGPFSGFIPDEIFGVERLSSVKHLLLFVLGGFLIGFGTRYAGGCTSGHAISGLSNFQLPSLIAVVGFFIGGLLMTHFFLPSILNILN